jgi:hypothetical protein
MFFFSYFDMRMRLCLEPEARPNTARVTRSIARPVPWLLSDLDGRQYHVRYCNIMPLRGVLSGVLFISEEAVSRYDHSLGSIFLKSVLLAL